MYLITALCILCACVPALWSRALDAHEHEASDEVSVTSARHHHDNIAELLIPLLERSLARAARPTRPTRPTEKHRRKPGKKVIQVLPYHGSEEHKHKGWRKLNSRKKQVVEITPLHGKDRAAPLAYILSAAKSSLADPDKYSSEETPSDDSDDHALRTGADQSENSDTSDTSDISEHSDAHSAQSSSDDDDNDTKESKEKSTVDDDSSAASAEARSSSASEQNADVSKESSSDNNSDINEYEVNLESQENEDRQVSKDNFTKENFTKENVTSEDDEEDEGDEDAKFESAEVKSREADVDTDVSVQILSAEDNAVNRYVEDLTEDVTAEENYLPNENTYRKASLEVSEEKSESHNVQSDEVPEIENRIDNLTSEDKQVSDENTSAASRTAFLENDIVISSGHRDDDSAQTTFSKLFDARARDIVQLIQDENEPRDCRPDRHTHDHKSYRLSFLFNK